MNPFSSMLDAFEQFQSSVPQVAKPKVLRHVKQPVYRAVQPSLFYGKGELTQEIQGRFEAQALHASHAGLNKPAVSSSRTKGQQ